MDAQFVFADCLCAARYSVGPGLSGEAAIVVTAAPAVALAFSDRPVRVVDSHINASQARSLAVARLRLAERVGERTGSTHGQHAGVVAAQAVLACGNLMWKALSLGEEYLTGRVLVVRAELDDGSAPSWLNGGWEDLLGSNPRVRVVTAICANHQPAERASDLGVPLGKRLKSAGLEQATYVMGRTLSRMGPRLPWTGHLLVFGRNDLVVETAAALACRGVRLQEISAPSPPGVGRAVSPDDVARFHQDLQDLMGSQVLPEILRPLAEKTASRVSSALAEFEHYQQAWRDRLADCVTTKRWTAVVANAPSGPVGLGLHAACQELGVPLAAAQHGVFPELKELLDLSAPAFESSSADLHLTYSEWGARLSQTKNRFAVGKTVGVGLPRSYRRTRRFWRISRPQTILFISMAGYAGHVNPILAEPIDYQRARFEIDLLQKVIARLPNPCVFKTYPSSPRYLDPDPVLEVARTIDNVEIIDEAIDFRFLTDVGDVYLLFGTGSTIGWCLSADRPLIFIDRPDLDPLRPELAEDFRRGVFSFDWKDPELHDQLRDLLSADLATIRHAWSERASARERVISRFLTVHPDGKAGRRAAQAVAEAGSAALKKRLAGPLHGWRGPMD